MSRARRKKILEDILSDLFSDPDALVQSVVREGWPPEMAAAGLEMHRRTWNVAEIDARLTLELSTQASAFALPDDVVHLWPTLPGAGVTPLLYGYLAGVKTQYVRPSRRASDFARHFVEVFRRHAPDALRLVEPGGAWDDHELVVVSGSDETVEAVVERYGDDRVVGYHHRVSFGVVVDGPNASSWCEDLATDVVMWHQRGCFSLRGVVFCGSIDATRDFAAQFGEAIARREVELGARDLAEAELAHRAQKRGVAEFSAELFGEGLGWVELRETPFDGEWISPHVVTLHRIDAREQLQRALALSPHHVQGVALGLAPDHREHAVWTEAIEKLGATRICAPGELQAPPASWPHDGRPNILGWLRPAS